MLTLVKWITNPDPKSKNRMITRTLGKIGLMPSKVLFDGGELPRSDEFWYSEIVCETKPGNQGVFVLRPIKRIGEVPHFRGKRPDFQYLIPGTFEVVRQRNAVLIYPHRKGQHWICAQAMRKFLLSMHKRNQDYPVNSVIVVFDNAEDWVTKGLPELSTVHGVAIRPTPGQWASASA